ncbi:STAS domain-containing protein [Bacillus testis]|uniref:hypothetical protein n=1 Tax=Bacillus testis TaxID=1622072 RepID=UPI00067E6D2C|nr:hypothetical protein [Bacillus testis]
MSEQDIIQMPVAYTKLSKDGHIIDFSLAAERQFYFPNHHIADILDEGSFAKFKALTSEQDERPFEVNIHTREKTIALFDAYPSYDPEYIRICFIPKDDKMKVMEENFRAIRKRLQETDLDLFHKKEELEEVLNKLDQLSGPFISLSSSFAFVPIFGDITSQKMKEITKAVSIRLFEGEYEAIAFDFTATGTIDEDGLALINQLLQVIKVMGEDTVINLIGLKAEHVKNLHAFQLNAEVNYYSSFNKFLNT